MLPVDSSSIDRVVSFFSRVDERSRGNSFSTRACLAAMSTPRYLLAALSLPTRSLGVKTRIVDSRNVERTLMAKLLLQPLDEHRDLMSQARDSLPAHYFRVDDRGDTLNCLA